MGVILNEEKAFGPERYPVIDIITGNDEGRRRTIFVTVGQNSICQEIINVDASGAEATRGQLPIKDVRTLYNHIDPAFEQVVELVQIWIWWDIPDCTDMARFDLQMALVKRLIRSTLTDETKERYRLEMKKSKG